MDQNTKDMLDALDFIKERMATKDDLQRFATKDDMRAMRIAHELSSKLRIGPCIEEGANVLGQ